MTAVDGAIGPVTVGCTTCGVSIQIPQGHDAEFAAEHLLEHLPACPYASNVTVTNPVTFQGVTLWLGDGCPVQVDDRVTALNLLDWISDPIQQAVIAARLRAIAALFDEASA